MRVLGGGGGLWLLYIGGRGSEVVHRTVVVFLWHVITRGLLERRR